ncbi:MAG: ATP-binding cassette domain-containing protein [Lachnospiraceae bacterium]|nr:ATP-binding cassette domain-containing protein [Lachnospiraceae bacterium]
MSEIEIKNLTKRFEAGGHEIVALNDVSLNIKKGEIYGIIGMSGAGKSTLVRSINYLEVPDEGHVLIDGVDLSGLSDKELRIKRRDIGMIFQGFNLLEQRNVIDNVCFPLEISGMKRGKARVKARELLETVNLADKEKSYPSQLSGGQKQRVAIARALATNPGILLCDEATSALDPQTTESILSLLKEINEKLNITIVVITHQMSVITDICTKVAIIENGRLVEEGLVEEIFASPKTDVARDLIANRKSGYSPVESLKSERVVRIVFSENSAFEPVISNLILKYNVPVNILGADTSNVGGKAKGEMLLGLPEDEDIQRSMINYLKERGLTVTEVREGA